VLYTVQNILQSVSVPITAINCWATGQIWEADQCCVRHLKKTLAYSGVWFNTKYAVQHWSVLAEGVSNKVL
jgi:hypothetical protein